MYQILGDTGIRMYDILSFMSFIPVFIFNFSQFNKKKPLLSKVSILLLNNSKKPEKLNWLETILILIEIYVISTFQYSFTGLINTSFGKIFNTGPNYFGLLFITPAILVLFFLLLEIDIFKQMDLITPAFPLALIPIKLACFCHGCCSGIECSFGFYNHFRDMVDFPIQLIEAGEALLIFIILMLLRSKVKCGTLFPIYLILYSSMRFFSEFFRYEENIIWIFKLYHLLCIVGIIVGVVELIIVLKYKNKIYLYYGYLKNRIRNYAVKNGIIKNKNIVHHKKRKKK